MAGEITLIVTGRYGQGTRETNEMVMSILGEQNTKDKFNVYFNWYNTVHEVGHVVEQIISDNICGLLERELFANEFAVAFWAHYGDKKTFDCLKEFVYATAQRFERPIAENEDISDCARRFESGELEFNFNNYGWFQFSLVKLVLGKIRNLESVLKSAGFALNKIPSPQTLAFSSLEAYATPEILKAVFAKLDELGIKMPRPVYHVLSDDPNAHMAFSCETPEAIEEMGVSMENANLIWMPSCTIL